MGEVHPLADYDHRGLFTGGVVQQVGGLVPDAYYRLGYSCKYEFRGFPPQLSLYHGIDLTGQTSDGNAATIQWSPDHVAVGEPLETHEVFYRREEVFKVSSPVVSIWLRAMHPEADTSFQVTVDAVSLKRIDPDWRPPGERGSGWLVTY
jgi:hypothetical protein